MRKDGQRYDKTQLRAAVHGRYIHRDYAAHFFRWVTIREAITPRDRILDIGCGQDVPLAYVLKASVDCAPALYVGTDLNIRLEAPGQHWCDARANFDFVTRWPELTTLGPFNIVTCFEVIEHMEPADGVRLLKGARALLAATGRFYLSTPVLGKKIARNHVHEYSVKELRQAVENAGFKVESRYGTFGNVVDLKKVLTSAEATCWEAWAPRLGNEGLSAVFATAHPDQSRNNLWVLKKVK